MFSFTRKTNYGLVALARLAQQLAAEGEPLSARQIADEYKLPVSLLMNVLKDLQRGGVIESTRGARGGYYLAHSPDRVSVADVILAIEGPIRITPCAGADPAEGKTADCHVDNCPIASSIQKLHDRLHGFLQDVTLEDLIASEVDEPTYPVAART